MQGHILEEWRIQAIEQKADAANRRLYEIDSLRSDVVSLTHAISTLSSVVDGLLSRLDAQENQARSMQDEIDSLRVSDNA